MALTVTAQGGVLVVGRDWRPTQLKAHHSTKRGSIRTFSRASRRRLIELLSRMDITRVRTSFLTLTFAAAPTGDDAKRALKMFVMRLRRAYPEFSGVWRLEPQQRGAWHFHILAFNLPYIPQSDLQQSWSECTREKRSIVHVQLVRFGKRQLMSYASKYMAKMSDGSTSLDERAYQHSPTEDERNNPGRFWGYINRVKLPFAPLRRVHIHDVELEAQIFYVERWWRASMEHAPLTAFRCYKYPPHEILAWLVSRAALVTYDHTFTGSERFTLDNLVDF